MAKKKETKPNAALKETINVEIRREVAKREVAKQEAKRSKSKPTTYTPRFTYDDFEAELPSLYPKKRVG